MKEKIKIKPQENAISSKFYNLIIGGVLLWGFYLNWSVVSYIPQDLVTSIGIYVLTIVFALSFLLGFLIFRFSKKPILSFIGYTLSVCLLGLTLNQAISKYDPFLVLNLIETFSIVAALLTATSIIYPKLFQKPERICFFALLLVISYQFVEIKLLNIEHSLVKWISTYLFCCYMAFIWSRANQSSKTIDNAIDGAASLYLGIFLLILGYFLSIIPTAELDDEFIYFS